MSEHHTFVGFKGDAFNPHCTCGWKGTTTRWGVDVDRQIRRHLADVDAPALAPRAHTYDGGRRHNWRRGA